jgi:hypothetical protein
MIDEKEDETELADEALEDDEDDEDGATAKRCATGDCKICLISSRT